MYYRIVAIALVLLGLYEIISHLTYPISVSPDSLERSAIGLATIFLGLFNWVYVYETPESKLPRFLLLAANVLFIGFSILLITSTIDPLHGYIALALSLSNSVMVLNHKV